MLQDLLLQPTATVPIWAILLPAAIGAAAAIGSPWIVQHYNSKNEQDKRAHELEVIRIQASREARERNRSERLQAFQEFTDATASFLDRAAQEIITLPVIPGFMESAEVDKAYFNVYWRAQQAQTRSQIKNVTLLMDELLLELPRPAPEGTPAYETTREATVDTISARIKKIRDEMETLLRYAEEELYGNDLG